MSNKYVGHYVDEDGHVDNKLTLTSDGFVELSEDLEAIVDKFAGVDGAGFMMCSEIREDLMDLIHEIINGKESEDE
tara:strand:- start:32 stop:259 length:228 start_codon:yes stop_codon:yes gene_type:complete